MKKVVLFIVILANYLAINNNRVREKREKREKREQRENLLKFFRDHPGY